MRSVRQITPAFFAALILLSACTPPGKPKPNDYGGENATQITDFHTLYTSNCAGCHGTDGMNGPARILNDAVYLSIIPREELRRVVVYGRSGTAMPAWAVSEGGPLTDQQIDLLVDGIYSNWGKGGTRGSAAPAYHASGNGDVNHGKQLFVRDCFMCHGKGAAIGPVTDPAYLSLSSNQMIRTSIIVGRRDLGMPNYEILNAGRPLSDQDVTDLVAYVASFRPADVDKNIGSVGPSSNGGEGNKGDASSSQRGGK